MKVFVCLLALALTAAIAADDIAGSWTFDLVQFGEETSPARVELKTNGETVTGTLNELKIEGTWKDGVLKVKVTRPTGNEWGTIEGRLNGADLRGTVHRGSDNLEWVARRVPAPSSAAPQTHAFEPTAFHRYFSGTIAPALHINPGDTVRTTTVDAGGTDFTGKRRSLGGNPETGPFYIEGAMPGDTLVVKFNRIRLNRDSAGSGDRITNDALAAGYIQNAKYDDNFSSEWKLDRDAGVAMLAKPSEHLKNYRVKLQPMLGCVAVALPTRSPTRCARPPPSSSAGWSATTTSHPTNRPSSWARPSATISLSWSTRRSTSSPESQNRPSPAFRSSPFVAHALVRAAPALLPVFRDSLNRPL